MKKIDAALLYASWGWWVFPLIPNAKTPYTKHGFLDATTDPDQIRRWWGINEDFNIGIALGEKSDLVVFDVDPRNGGDETWQMWLDTHGGELPEGIQQLTPSGGSHLFCHYDPAFVRSQSFGGVDVLSNGKYVVVTPSNIEDRHYTFELSSDPFDGIGPAIIPDSWRETYLNISHRSDNDTSGVIAQKIADGGRNNALTSIAGSLRHFFGLSASELSDMLHVLNRSRCETPLPDYEIRKIAESIGTRSAGYDLDHVVIGNESANALLMQAADERDYYYTRATNYLSQPAPLDWTISGWIPSSGVTMIYGESGIGKTFVCLDIACSIAAGIPWHGVRTKCGPVIYLCGEGNYGMRQRIASWCRHHNITNLDNLIISNRAIDVDNPSSLPIIVRAIQDMIDGPAALIIFDTLNTHMSGDENSAQDTRKMIQCCKAIGAALKAPFALVHHTGHGESATRRARGSSAWRASLDASLMVGRAQGSEDLIELSCTKMKDAEAPQTLYGKLSPVELGWINDDGDEIKGAVFTIETNPQLESQLSKKDSKIKTHIKRFSEAWFAAGADELDNAPYITKAALVNVLVTEFGMSELTARQMIKPNADGKLITDLILSNIIRPEAHGWIVIDDTLSSSLLIQKYEN